MIIPAYEIKPSLMNGAGKGLFICQDVPRGSIMVVPDGIRPDQLISLNQLNQFPVDSPEQESSVRWYENTYTINLEWTDECYINHSFTPNGIWHLGFIFAEHDIPSGTEITIDYRFIIPEGEALPFLDSQTGEAIVGYSWEEIIMKGIEQMKTIFDR